MRATWTRHKCLTYFCLWRFDTRSMYYARLWEHLADTTSAHARRAWFRTLRCFSKGDRTVRTKFESAFIQKLSEITAWMRATWTRHKCLTYFCLWRFDTRSMYYAREHLADTTSAHARGAWFRTLRCFSKGDRTVRTKFESAFIQKLSEITAWNFDSW